MPERKQLRLAVGKRVRDVAGYGAANTMRFRRFFHSCRDIDGTSVNPDRPLGIALLADDDLAAMHPNAEAGYHAELPLICRLLSPDGGNHRIDRPQDLVSPDRLVPIPQRDQTVALIEVDFSAVVGDRLGDVEEELADQRLD